MPAMLLALLLQIGCRPAAAPPRSEGPLESVEARFDSLRFLRDQIDVALARGVEATAQGVPLAALRRAYEGGRAELAKLLETIASDSLDPADGRALAAMREVLRASLGPAGDSPGTVPAPVRPICRYHPREVGAGPSGLDTLTARIFACYGEAARRIVVDRDTLDRLSILGLLGASDHAGRRERLFRALAPVWRSVNGDNEVESPYRELVRLRRQRWGDGVTPMVQTAASFGLTLHDAERWLTQALEAWRAALPDTVLEPWDYYHLTGLPGRRFRDRVSVDSLLALNHRFYRSLGVDPESLGIRYDLTPRDGKYPIAFTTFGARRIARPGSVRSEPWVFASYRIGGFDNLAELLHETGHAIHIAAIDTRPAYHDWPDADPFTEGVADLAALEIYEPWWQAAYLGDSVPLAASLRAKYGGIMLDMAWALFEIVGHRPGAPSPNAVWADITSRYLRIRPRPELSWWAVRGQLIGSPGYMLNYALGAFLVADLRQALAGGAGHLESDESGWYRRVSASLFRFGAEVPAGEVVRTFLGRKPTPEALLADLARITRRGD